MKERIIRTGTDGALKLAEIACPAADQIEASSESL